MIRHVALQAHLHKKFCQNFWLRYWKTTKNLRNSVISTIIVRGRLAEEHSHCYRQFEPYRRLIGYQVTTVWKWAIFPDKFHFQLFTYFRPALFSQNPKKKTGIKWIRISPFRAEKTSRVTWWKFPCIISGYKNFSTDKALLVSLMNKLMLGSMVGKVQKIVQKRIF